MGKANASIKSINSGLSSIEQAAAKSARGASAGIDGITVSMVKGPTAGNLLADAIKKAIVVCSTALEVVAVADYAATADLAGSTQLGINGTRVLLGAVTLAGDCVLVSNDIAPPSVDSPSRTAKPM